MAEKENPNAEVILAFHEVVRTAIADGKEARSFAKAFIQKHPNAVVVCDEVGMGIVPMEPKERLFRESVGRVVCLLAQYADTVVRVTCGIGIKIK